tara:strand:+ start:303 stop:863 length:561 start_codon:yes stop_codon:yes gene_type:complete
MQKKGALELSIGTIVIIVIAITMLILGIVFVRSIMCSGIQISEDLSVGVRNEVKSLFGADKYGVKCMGEGGKEVKLGTGGRRTIVCIIKEDESTTYNIKAVIDESLKEVTTKVADTWVLDSGWKGDVIPGGEGKETVVMLLDIPRDAPTTTLKLKITAENERVGTTTYHYSYIDIVPAGFFKTTLC